MQVINHYKAQVTVYDASTVAPLTPIVLKTEQLYRVQKSTHISACPESHSLSYDLYNALKSMEAHSLPLYL